MQIIMDALQYLAQRCDYAANVDGQGFNKIDAPFGHSLAQRGELSYGQQIAALKMLRKYVRQLTNAGITLPDTIPAPVVEPFNFNGRGGIVLSGDRVEIRFPSIPPESDRTYIKSLKNWRYDGGTRAWSVPVSESEKIIERFPSLPVDSQISAKREEAKALAEAEKEREENTVATLLNAVGDLSAPLPSGRVLFPYQQEGVRRLLKDCRIILADDMGLGKTVQTLVAASAWQRAFDLPVFVVCPASLQDNWRREAEGVGVSIEVYSWAKMPEAPEAEFVLIADEAHYAQAGGKSQRGAKYLALAGNEKCVAHYALTGTPIKNGRPVNLFPLLQAVRSPLSKDKKSYETRYCNAHATRWTRWDVTGATHLAELHEKIQPCLLRRLKADCLKDLPAKIRTLRRVEMSAEARKTYDSAFAEMRKEYKFRLAKGEIMSGGEALVLLTHLRRAGSVAKSENAVEIAEEFLEQGQSVVMFCEFRESVENIARELERYGVEVLTGDAPACDRQAMVDRFQSGQSKIFLSTTKAGGVGITLTASSTVILVDRPWTPGDAIQAEDRCHRIGQRESVFAYWLQANGVDAKIDNLLLDKAEKIDAVLAGEESQYKTLSLADMAAEVLKEICEV